MRIYIEFIFCSARMNSLLICLLVKFAHTLELIIPISKKPSLIISNSHWKFISFLKKFKTLKNNRLLDLMLIANN